ncbi:MAG: VWA domain-containing protein [Bacteroidota bacterium]
MNPEQQRRWRLILGQAYPEETEVLADESDLKVDEVLGQLYDSTQENRKGGLGASRPRVSRWLGDIRTYFPKPVVQMLQKDAFERLGLQEMLLEPELLETVEADVHLVATLLSLKNVIPAKTKDTARMVVTKLVRELQAQLRLPTIQAAQGALTQQPKLNNPSFKEIDWNRSIRKNLKHYQPEEGIIIPQQLVGLSRRKRGMKDLIICLDQSGSMASSIVYASIFGAALASMPSLRTKLIAFDTAVVDLSEHLHDPVDLLFGVELGGGTDIARALKFSVDKLISRPKDTVMVMVTDLFEGGSYKRMMNRFAAIKAAGVKLMVLLALDNEGAPFFHHQAAAQLNDWNIPTFACSPQEFPEKFAQLMRN